MTTHIEKHIIKTILGGGLVIDKLKKYIDTLENVRHPYSIEKEFKDAFKKFEATRGSITPLIKQRCFDHINKIWMLYPLNEKEVMAKSYQKYNAC